MTSFLVVSIKSIFVYLLSFRTTGVLFALLKRSARSSTAFIPHAFMQFRQRMQLELFISHLLVDISIDSVEHITLHLPHCAHCSVLFASFIGAILLRKRNIVPHGQSKPHQMEEGKTKDTAMPISVNERNICGRIRRNIESVNIARNSTRKMVRKQSRLKKKPTT